MNTPKYSKKLTKPRIYWVVALFFLSACTEIDDVTLIKQSIEKGAKLAENQDLNGLLKLTTQDFIAQPGRHDNREVKTIIWLAFKHYRKFNILYPEPAIRLETNGRSAKATVKFLIVRKGQSLPDLDELWKNPEKWLKEMGESADLYRLQLDWVKGNEGWLVNQAHLKPFRGLGFGN
jgi:hypothetical protein